MDKHTVWVKIKVEAESRQKAEEIVAKYMRKGGEACYEQEPAVSQVVKYWSLKK